MGRRHWLISIASCLVIAPIAFALGRWSGWAKHPPIPTHYDSGMASPKNAYRAEEKDFKRVAIENLGQVEFEQAYELIHTAPKPALIAWAKRLEAMPFTPRKTSAISVFFRTLAQVDTKAAVEVALAMERSDPRWTAVGAIVAAAPAANLGDVARIYTTLHEEGIAITGELVARWSAIDPNATARFLATYPGKVTNDDLVPFVWNWAALDPTAATAWLANAEPKRRDPSVYSALYGGWIVSDRPAALTDLATHGEDKTFENALKTVSETLFTESADAARAFILTLPSGGAQKVAVDQVTGHITGFWFGGDYLHLKADEVARWLYALPDQLWTDQIGHVINRWAREDTAAVDAWLNQMPPQTRDRLLAEYCLARDWNTPTAGLQAGLHISDPALRLATFRKGFKDLGEDVKQELLEKAALSPDEARELNQILSEL